MPVGKQRLKKYRSRGIGHSLISDALLTHSVENLHQRFDSALIK